MSFGRLGKLGRGFGRLGGALGTAGTSPAPPNTLVAGKGTFVLTGDAMNPLVDFKLPSSAGSFIETGQDATLTYVPSGAPFSLTATANAVDTSALTTYTFASQNFGTAHSSRIIAVCILSRNAGSTPTVTAASTTIGGVTVTKAVEKIDGTAADGACIVYAAVPTGTSGTVSITFASGNSRCAIQVYSIIAPSSAAPTATGTSAANDAPTATLTIPTGGAAIGCNYSLSAGPGTPVGTPTGFTNLDLNNNITGTQQVWAMHSNAGALSGSQALTMTLTGSTTNSACFATWGP